MTDFKNIDDLFKTSQGDWNAAPSTGTWENLSDRLQAHAADRTHHQRVVVRWSIAASILLLLGLTYFFLNISPTTYNGQIAQTNEVEIPNNIASTYDKKSELISDKISPQTLTESTSIKNKSNNITARDINASTDTDIADYSAPAATRLQSEKMVGNTATNKFESDDLANKDVVHLSPSFGYNEEDYQSDTEAESLEEVILSERDQTVVANYIGIEKERAKHEAAQKEQKKSKRTAKEPFIQDQHNGIAAGAATDIKERDAFYEAENQAGDFIFTNKVIYIYCSIGKNACHQATIKLMDEIGEYYPCDNSNEPIALTLTEALRRLYELTVKDLRGMEFEKIYLDCPDDAETIKIIIENGDDLSEAFYWSFDCPTPSTDRFL
ncbi:MAG: hypothetical protein KDD32_13610, partial [Bacteroidetes bacterium]|nr:hypothetical protein [Bacteroidota bacterium]